MGIRDLIRPFLPAWLRGARHALYVARNATYNTDGLMTVHIADFLTEPRFQEAYRLGRETGSWGLSHIPWRAYVACWAGRHALHLPGDFVECGVNRGGLSRAVMHYTDFARETDRRFYLLDTFCGFPENLTAVAAEANLADYHDCHDDVVRTFRDFPNVVIIRGEVPATLAQVPSPRIAWLSIDMNVAEPEVAAVEYFWDRLVPGAVVVLDDYGYGESYRRQKTAMDELAARLGVQVLLLPTGQGLIIKP